MQKVAESSAARKLKKQLPTSQIASAPTESDPGYDPSLAALASRILYRSGVDPSGSGPLYVLCAAALPDPQTTDYNLLLPYVLSCLPTEDELSDAALGGGEYSLVFFAGSRVDGKTHRPPWGWILQAYYLLGRAVRKKIRRLWIVHERSWVRILIEMLQTVVSPKFRKKIVHVTDITELATIIDITKMDIPLQVYLHDRRLSPEIDIPNPPPPIFGSAPFPPSGAKNAEIPLILIQTTRYLRVDGLMVEGIFRIAPSKAILDIAEEAYNRRQRLRLSDYGPHVAAGLVKLYYRSLPNPIIPSDIYEDLEVCFGKDSPLSKEEVLRRFLKNEESEGGLPEFSRELLCRHLLPLLSMVAAYSETNKMGASNLAICVSPSLVRSDDIMRDTMIARGPVSQLIRWGIEEIDFLNPDLPARMASRPGGGGSENLNEQKVIRTPIRKPVPPAEVSTRDVSKVADYYDIAVPEIRQQPIAPLKPAKPREVQQQQQRSIITNHAQQPTVITPPSLSPKTIPEQQQKTTPERPQFNVPEQKQQQQQRTTGDLQSLPTPPVQRTRAVSSVSPFTITQSSNSPSTSNTLPVPKPRVPPRRGSFTIQVEPPPPPSYAPPKPLRKLSSSSALGSAYLRGIAANIPNPDAVIDLSTPPRTNGRVSLGGSSSNPSTPGVRVPLAGLGQSKTPPPPSTMGTDAEKEGLMKPRRVMTELGPRAGAKRLASPGMVEELRRLYEERATGVQVLVNSGPKRNLKA